MSTPVRKRESVKVETSNSGRRYVSIRELIKGEMERLTEQDTPLPDSGAPQSPEPICNQESEEASSAGA